MNLKLLDYSILGNYLFMVYDVLSWYVREANIQGIKESQALIGFSFFLTGFTWSQYKAELERVSPMEGGATCSPRDMHYLLIP